MVAADSVRNLCERIVAQFQPERVVLFGSYAYGSPTDYSDVDLLVVLPFEGKRSAKELEILRAIAPRFSVDLLAYTPEELRWRLEQNDFFLREVVEKGKTLYAAPDRRVDRQGGG